MEKASDRWGMLMENAREHWRTLQNIGVRWRTLVEDVGEQWRTLVENIGEQWRTLEDAEAPCQGFHSPSVSPSAAVTSHFHRAPLPVADGRLKIELSITDAAGTPTAALED